MGTRADFYIGRGTGATWLGSIAWDGYPDGIDTSVMEATTQSGFVQALSEFFKTRDDVSLADHDGWPWPWEDSRTTDFAYALDGGKVWVACFGRGWIAYGEPTGYDEITDSTPFDGLEKQEFPNMSHIKDVARGKRSGLITFG